MCVLLGRETQDVAELPQPWVCMGWSQCHPPPGTFPRASLALGTSPKPFISCGQSGNLQAWLHYRLMPRLVSHLLPADKAGDWDGGVINPPVPRAEGFNSSYGGGGAA